MIRSRRLALLVFCLPVLLMAASLNPGQPASPGAAASGSKTWVGRYQEVEEYLKTAECVRMQELKPGVASVRRCDLQPGGPVARMSWKALPPGVYRGFRESYKSDIAAYELDKLLKMDMVPPTVERELKGHKGAATMWVENLVDWSKAAASRNEAVTAHWEKQLVRMRMFDNLIGNKDRNRANMLSDAAGNLILIDHSRAFGPDAGLLNKLTEIDSDFWAKVQSLTRSQLDAALRPWLEDGERAAIMARREKMRTEIRLLGR